MGLFCKVPPNPTWKYSGAEGAVPFTDPSQTPEDGICSLLCCRKESCQKFQRDQICFPPPWLRSKTFKGAAQAGFTRNFVGFLAQTPNLNHRPGEVKTTTISPFPLKPKQKKTPSDLGTSTQLKFIKFSFLPGHLHYKNTTMPHSRKLQLGVAAGKGAGVLHRNSCNPKCHCQGY